MLLTPRGGLRFITLFSKADICLLNYYLQGTSFFPVIMHYYLFQFYWDDDICCCILTLLALFMFCFPFRSTSKWLKGRVNLEMKWTISNCCWLCKHHLLSENKYKKVHTFSFSFSNRTQTIELQNTQKNQNLREISPAFNHIELQENIVKNKNTNNSKRSLSFFIFLAAFNLVVNNGLPLFYKTSYHIFYSFQLIFYVI